MSSATIQYGGSEIIEHLPISTTPLEPTEYARIAPLLNTVSSLTRPLRHYLIAMTLFVVLSFSFIDSLIVGYAPSLGQVGIALTLVKAAIFGIALYMIDFLLASKN